MPACQEATEACLKGKEATSLEVESVMVQEEVPKEEAAVESFGALKKWHRDQCLAIGCHRELKKLTQGDGGSWKKLAITCRGMTHQEGVVQHKGCGHEDEGSMVKQR
jgi:hypothetical protein